MMYFFDTYVILALLQGEPPSRAWKEKPAVCHPLDLLEAMVGLLRRGTSDPVSVLRGLDLRTVEADSDDLLVAAALKDASEGRRRNFGYADVLGYTLARRLGYSFVTGDEGFRGLPGVEMVS